MSIYSSVFYIILNISKTSTKTLVQSFLGILFHTYPLNNSLKIKTSPSYKFSVSLIASSNSLLHHSCGQLLINNLINNIFDNITCINHVKVNAKTANQENLTLN